MTGVVLCSFLVGCGGNEPRVYEVRRSSESNTESTEAYRQGTAPETTFERPASHAMVDQVLPANAVNLGGDGPAFEVPGHWQEGVASAMRRGSFRVTGPEGEGDISITSFPGDVGGLLANINRWRGQLGLGPISEADLPAATEVLPARGIDLTLVEFDGPSQGTVTAIAAHSGASWFFRLTGPTALVARERDSFMEFLRTIEFPDV
ncbi:MAG: hypothetical protein JJT96_04260 [Opitutales bacterium]|nr:hypothetical protein [Opitutales bacterium]